MRRLRWVMHLGAVLGLTVLTQVGGIAWLIALGLRRFWLGFVLAYAVLWGAVQVVAPLTGRVALPCRGEVLAMQSPLYCVMLRNFVTPGMRDVALAAAGQVAARYPGTVTLALDAGFPFLTGFPLIPHLSHDDGEKLDFAFYYKDEAGYAPGRTASPIGYFAFERVGTEACPKVFPTLRWDMAWFQPLVRAMPLDRDRTAALVRALLADGRVGRVLLEPPLAASLGLADARLRFQGCRAARHDDHIHVQL